MDIGVGLYIVTSAIVASPRLSLTSFLRSELVLLALGFTRWLFIRGFSFLFVFIVATGYVTSSLEYGRDWNFFFSLAVVFAAGRSALHLISSPYVLLAGGLGIAGYYQLLLSIGLSHSLRAPSEKGWLMANAVGMFACFGLISLYWMCAGIAGVLRRRGGKCTGWMVTFWAASGSLFWLLDTYVEPASRRMVSVRAGIERSVMLRSCC